MMSKLTVPSRSIVAAAALCFAGAAAFPTVVGANTIYLIVAGDTSRQANLGTDVEQDVELILSVFASNVPPQQLRAKRLTGDDLSERNVMAAIQEAPATANDSIVFYFTGHGRWDSGRQEHVLQFAATKETVFRNDIRSAIIARQPRAAIVITDCCAGGQVAREPLEPKRIDIARTISPLFRRLFLEYSGVICITSSQPGENSFTRGDGKGSVFTYPFVKELESLNQQTLSWTTVIDRTAEQVKTYFEDRWPEGIPVDLDGDGRREKLQKTQTVYAFLSTPRLGMRVLQDGDSLRVTDILVLSPAHRAGINVEDQLIAINGRRIATERQYSDAVDHSDRQMRITVLDHRTRHEKEVGVELND